MISWEFTGLEYTNYWGVNIMWYVAEMVKTFEKMTERYEYDIYQNIKLCVALCNNLYFKMTLPVIKEFADQIEK